MNGIFRQGRRVWRYAAVRAIHNSLPFFAILAAVGTLWSPIAIIVLVQIFTGMIVDLHFFPALAEKVKNGER